jgi:Na+/proline symporter
MRLLDWAVLIGYLVYVVWDGIRLSRSSRGSEGYFLAGRNIPWWAVGLSVMATQLSAVTLVGATGQGFGDGVRFVQFYLGLPLAMVILCVTAVPFFYRAKVYTAYEFLERRFDAKTRALTGLLFLVSRGLSVSVILAAPAIILAVLFGWNEAVTILFIGATTTVYTMIGGVRVVAWTDVKQMVVIFFGMSVVMFIILSRLPAGVSFLDGLHLAGAAGRLNAVSWKFDLKERYTIWSGTIGALFLFLSYFGCDQSQVQRYLTAKSVDEGRVSLLMSAFIKIPMQFFMLLVGVMIFVFYLFNPSPLFFRQVAPEAVAAAHKTEELERLRSAYAAASDKRQQAATEYARSLDSGTPETIAAARATFTAAHKEASAIRTEGATLLKSVTSGSDDVNYVFPTFVVRTMPAGVVGLIIAAIFAAAMSSSSGELNSLATASAIDFYKRWINPEASDAKTVLAGRVATAVWGGFACLAAIFMTKQGSLLELVNKYGSFFYGSLLGVFVLAFLVRRVNGTNAFIGLISGMIGVWVVSRVTDIAFLWFNLIGCVIVVMVGWTLSFITGGRREPTGTD